MGSTGSGSFTDYSGSKNPKGGGGSGGSSGVDKCSQAFSCTLQEVAQCDYLKTHGAPPPIQTMLRLIFDGRIFAVDANGTKVGALPTTQNYLAACLNDGFKYVGVVTASLAKPLPSVSADFRAE